MKRKCYGFNVFINSIDKHDMSISVTSVRSVWLPTTPDKQYKRITRSSLARLEYLSTTYESRCYLSSIGSTFCIFNK